MQMTIREKIEAIRKVQDIRSEISEFLGRIIKHTSDYHCDCVDDFTIDNKNINVNYLWTCRGEHGHDDVTIPIEWLDEGFDYRKAYQDCLWKAREAAIKKAAAAEKREKKRKEKEEYENYLKLKKKFEGGK